MSASRALLRSYVKDAYNRARAVGQFLRLDLPTDVIVDRSLRVEGPERITIERGVSIGRNVRLKAAGGTILIREGAVLNSDITLTTEGAGTIEIGRGVVLGHGVIMRTLARIVIGERSEVLERCSIEPREDNACGDLIVGDRTTVHAYNWLDTTASIHIGSDTHTGPFSLFYTHNHRYDGPGSIWAQGLRIQEIRLGEGIWMGSRTMIMPGAVVGDGAVIAAGSIVTKQFGRGDIIVGAPAKLLRTRGGV